MLLYDIITIFTNIYNRRCIMCLYTFILQQAVEYRHHRTRRWNIYL